MKYVLVLLSSVFLISADLQARTLFNGSQGAPSSWIVQNGTIRNTGSGDDIDWLKFDEPLAADTFSLSIKLKVLDCSRFPRPRIFLNGQCGDFYFGNEGFLWQYEIYGSVLSNVRQVGDDSYVAGNWYDLKVMVDAQNQVSLFKDGVLTHTAIRTSSAPLQLVISGGDNWSPGHIEIASVEYAVPEPTTLLMLGLGVVMLRKRR
jgi:hypothetical protein